MSTGRSLAMMPFFPRDYVTATRHFSLAERGAYTDLLFFQWENGTLPQDPERLARLIGCTQDEFSRVWPQIRDKFRETGTGLINSRLEEHRTESLRLRAKRTDGAEKTNAKRHAQRAAQRDGSETLSDTPSGTLSVTLGGTSPSPSPSPSPSESPSPAEKTKGNGAAAGKPRPRSLVSPEFRAQVIAAWNEIVLSLRECKDWHEERETALHARVRDQLKRGKQADQIEYWRNVFKTVEASDFLCGRVERDGRTFRAGGIDWVLKRSNFTKIMEGNYDNTLKPRNGARYL